MVSFLGSRGKLAVGAGAAVALAVALLAFVQSDWAIGTALVLLAGIWVLAASIWGVVRALHRQLETLEQNVAQLRRRVGRGSTAAEPTSKKLHAALDKVAEDVARLAVKVGPTKADGFGNRSLERRYADYLTQPASVPNSQLLAYMEILAKEATTRRADMAVIQDLLAEIRTLREMQGQPAAEPL